MTANDQTLTSLPEAITRAAARDPQHPALSMGGRRLTYEDLERKTNSVANMLIAHGVRRGDRVGLYAHKSIELLIGLFGVMKAGAAYVPINPDAPAAYLQHILEDCEIRHLMLGPTTSGAAVPTANAIGLTQLIGIEPSNQSRVDQIGWDDVWSYSTAPADVQVRGNDLAYIIFTSGSTGRPKGIVHTHRSGLAYGEVAAGVYGFRAADRIANHPPLNFDLSLLELFGGIIAGATIVLVPETHVRLPASLSALLEDERVTVLNAVPFALVQLLRRGALEQRDLSSLRWVLFGGEVFPTADLRSLMQMLPNARFANVYGPAEVNGVTFFIVPDLAEGNHEPIPIGRLYPDMRALVVDSHNRQVPPGTVGELLINSPTHMVGYWRQSELTARSTYEEIDTSGDAVRWHRTGDLVTVDDGGLFRLVGRKDRMIKTRGHRVELDEVESVLDIHPDVESAVVYAVPDDEGSHRIEASITLRSGLVEPPDSSQLKRHIAQLLPRYAVPHIIRIVESVPRTSSGKADRVALVAAALSEHQETDQSR